MSRISAYVLDEHQAAARHLMEHQNQCTPHNRSTDVKPVLMQKSTQDHTVSTPGALSAPLATSPIFKSFLNVSAQEFSRSLT